MTDRRIEYGKLAEAAAIKYLRELGFEILAKNWRRREGEIDIIADEAGCIHFIEVKSRHAPSGINPIENWSDQQRERFFLMAETYIAENPDLTRKPGYGISLDFIGLELTEDGGIASIEFVRDALRPS